MHRAALRLPLRHAVPHRRSFVSTVLLTKTWENETVVELRKEARKRGLPSSGNKATLITRLQQDDHNQSLAPEPTPAVPTPQARYASTSTSTSPAETPTEVPGIPSTADPVFVKFNLDIAIPDTDYPIPEPPVQIPLMPDLWDSSKIDKASAPLEAAPSTDPKVVVVGGEATHPGGGPSHNLYVPSLAESPDVLLSESTPQKEPTSQLGRLVAGMADDLGVPTSVPLPSFKLTFGGEDAGSVRSRPLDQQEKQGAWALLGLLAGSWVFASVLSTSSAWEAEEHAHDESH